MEDKPRSLQGRAEFVEALVDAADRILEDSEARVAFIRIAGLQKLDALHRMAVMDEPGYEVRLQQAVAQLAQVDDKRVRSEVDFLELEAKVMQVSELDAEPRQKLLEEIKAFLSQGKNIFDLHLQRSQSSMGLKMRKLPNKLPGNVKSGMANLVRCLPKVKTSNLRDTADNSPKALPRRRTVSSGRCWNWPVRPTRVLILTGRRTEGKLS